MIRAILFALVLSLAAATPSQAEPKPEPLQHLPAITGDYFPVHSDAADWDYHIYVRLPPDYAEHPEHKYPIVYLLDGDSLFPVVGGNHIFLNIDDKIPEAIIVGIAYGGFASPPNRRHIDFMPPGPDVKPGDARIADFHAFLKDELIPAVEPRYRVDPQRRILFGQSRGGAMVLYSAFVDPDLFWARIASNPSWKPGGRFSSERPPGRTGPISICLSLSARKNIPIGGRPPLSGSRIGRIERCPGRPPGLTFRKELTRRIRRGPIVPPCVFCSRPRPTEAHGVRFWRDLDGLSDEATSSAASAPRAPIGLSPPSVVSSAVCRSSSALISPPNRNTTALR